MVQGYSVVDDGLEGKDADRESNAGKAFADFEYDDDVEEFYDDRPLSESSSSGITESDSELDDRGQGIRPRRQRDRRDIGDASSASQVRSFSSLGSSSSVESPA